jgi:predicted HicB family RNase H-like nuclease
MKKSTNFRFNLDFHQRMKQAAETSGISLTAWVVSACSEKLEREKRRADRG